jgi:hypothetical protein
MKKIIFLIVALSILAVGCGPVKLTRPTSVTLTKYTVETDCR